MTIRFISLVPLAAVALACTVFILFFSSRYNQLQDRLITERFEELTRSNALAIDREVDRARHNVSRLKQALSLFDAWEPVKAQRFLEGLMADTLRDQDTGYKAWLALSPERAQGLFGTEGHLVTVRKDPREPGAQPYGHPEHALVEVWTDSHDPAPPKDLAYGLAQTSRDVVLTPVYFDASPTKAWVISVLQGLYEGDHFQGLVSVDLLWDDLLRHVEEVTLGETGGLVLVDAQSGKILTRARPAAAQGLFDAHAPFQQSLYASSGGRRTWEPILLHGAQRALVRSEGGDEFVVSSRRIASLPWSLVAYQSRSELRDAVCERLNAIVPMVASLLAFLGLGAWLTVRNLAAPIDRLVEVMKRVHGSHVDALQAPVLGTVETRELGVLFNDMLRTIGDATREKEASYAKLEESHHTLENKVEERTRELRDKNASLENTLRQLRATQEQLVAKDKLASLAALTAGIAHEIKNPLNFVKNFAELSEELVLELRREAERQGPPGPLFDLTLRELGQNVQRITEHGKRANTIVQDMLLHSNTNKAESRWTDLNALVTMHVELACKSSRLVNPGLRVRVLRQLDPAVGEVFLCPQDFGRALLNVIDNGFYAMDLQRKLVSPGFQPELSVCTRRTQDHVEVRIRDNGSGMPDHILDKIFNPFFTTKAAGAGTGLGMSITYEIIVNAHRGMIEVESEEGQYTEVAFLLPLKRAAA